MSTLNGTTTKSLWPFSPQGIPGLALWLDPSDATTIVKSGGVSLVSIRDKSGSGNLWTPVTPNTIQTNSTQINGRPTLGFISGYYLTGSYTLNAGYNSTIFAIVRSQSYENITIFGDSGPSIVLAAPSGDGGNLEMYYAPDYNYDGYASGIAYKSNITYIICVSISATDTGSSATCTVNGTEYLVDYYGDALSSTGSNTITTSTTGSTDGNSLVMGEIIVYSYALNTLQRQQVESYLASKWLLQGNLPTTHPYYATSGMKLYNAPVFQRAFSPVDISGCSLWLDAADQQSITLSSSSVTTWADKSGNGYNASGGVSPTYSSNGVQFNGSSYLTTSAPAGNNSATYFIVFKPSSIGFTVLLGGNALSTATLFVGSSTSFVLGDWNSNVATFTTSFSAGTTYLASGMASGGVLSVSINAGTMATGSATFSGTGTFTVGAGYTDNRAKYSGAINEIIVFNSALSSSQRQQVESYLAWKWGLVSSLASEHPGKILPAFSTSFNPKSLSGMTLWLDAADTSSLTISPFAWTDKSGQGNTPTATGTLYGGTPVLPSSTGTINGIQAVRFSSSLNNEMLTTMNYNSTAITNYAVSFFLVVQLTSAAQGRLFGGTTSSFQSYTLSPYNPPCKIGIYTYGSPAEISSVANVSPSVPFILGFTVISGLVTGFLNGTAFAATSTVTSSSFTTVQWGGLGGNTPIDGNIGEIVVFNSGLSTTQRQQVEGYLAWKWGLQNNLPSTHAYKKIKP